jgi:hypothetical protein
MESWTVEEAVALSLGKEPGRVSSRTLGRLRNRVSCTPSALVRQIGAIQEGRISGSS